MKIADVALANDAFHREAILYETNAVARSALST